MQWGLLAIVGAGIGLAMVGACSAFGDNGDAVPVGADATPERAAEPVDTSDGSAEAATVDGDAPRGPTNLPNVRLWLEAGSLNGLKSDSQVAIWPDARGVALSASQKNPDARPTFV